MLHRLSRHSPSPIVAVFDGHDSTPWPVANEFGFDMGSANIVRFFAESEWKMSNSIDGQMLRVCDVAERLNVSAQCVYQLVDRGKLIAHRIGIGRGAIRVSETDLQQFLRNSRMGKTPANTTVRQRTLKHIRR